MTERARVVALADRLARRLRELGAHLPGDAGDAALEDSGRLLRRVDDVIDSAILASRRRD